MAVRFGVLLFKPMLVFFQGLFNSIRGFTLALKVPWEIFLLTSVSIKALFVDGF